MLSFFAFSIARSLQFSHHISCPHVLMHWCCVRHNATVIARGYENNRTCFLVPFFFCRVPPFLLYILWKLHKSFSAQNKLELWISSGLQTIWPLDFWIHEIVRVVALLFSIIFFFHFMQSTQCRMHLLCFHMCTHWSLFGYACSTPYYWKYLFRTVKT